MTTLDSSSLDGAARSAPLWAITSYFNPMGYRRRLANYRAFRRHLNVPLVTVEWTWELGTGFQLERQDADVLLQIRGPDLMWQKERLLNLALPQVPEECEHIAWLDCDVVFEDPRWHLYASEGLRDVSLIHLYETVGQLHPNQSLPPWQTSEFLSVVRSVASLERLSPGAYPVDIEANGYSGGYAWAGRADLLRRHGFYDAMIVGGGDRAVVNAVMGCVDEMLDALGINPTWAEHYRAWAEPFGRDAGDRVAHVPGRLFHLWHGSVEDRRYTMRHQAFDRFHFDPSRDITIGQSGDWRWSRRNPQLHAFLRDYFAGRREDGSANDVDADSDMPADTAQAAEPQA